MIRKFALAAVCTVALSASALAGDIKVVKAWAHAMNGGQHGAGHVFLEINNSAATADRLYAVKSKVSRMIKIGQTAGHGEMSKAHDEVLSILVPAEKSTVFDGSGPHVQLLKLVEPLVVGSTFEVTLFFENAGRVKTKVLVQTEMQNHEKGHGNEHKADGGHDKMHKGDEDLHKGHDHDSGDYS